MTPSPIEAALPVIWAFVWIVPPPSASCERDVGVRVPLPSGFLGLDAHHDAVGGGVLLDDLHGAGEGQGHRSHLDLDLGPDGVRRGRLEHAAALDAGDDALEVEDRRVALVERLRRGEGVVEVDGHLADATLSEHYPRGVSREDVLIRAGRLAEDGKPYVLATVVRVERPASTRPGDRALILPDGRLDGWVGGACSEPIVIREAMRALADGEPRVVRIGPSGSGDDAPDDVVVAESSCASEGTVEVLVEPQVPRPLLVVVGDSEAAITLADLARAIDWRVATEQPADADAVVVATMGHADEEALELALGGRAGYVGLVASARRAGVVLDALRARGVGEDDLARVRSPAGLDLGPATQPEIAVAILAELVAWRHTRGGGETVLLEAVDPICGMTVAVDGRR